MKTYAYVVGGVVRDVIAPNPDKRPIEECFTPEFVAACVALTAAQAKVVAAGWLYDGSSFSAPAGPGAPPPAPVYTRRRHIWERATAEESASLSAALEQADDKMAQIFLASDWIDHSNDLWPMLTAAITQAVGVDRAAVLLAPSQYPEP